MRVLVVDDEPPARHRLSRLVGELNVGEVVGEASNGAEAVRATVAKQPEVVLLDIRMPGMDGLEAARHLASLEQPPAVIFTTAYDGHALAAFEAGAVDYLVKPIRRERLASALDRAQQLTRAQLLELQSEELGQSSARTHVSATMHGKLHLVPIDEVRYFLAEHKYVTVSYPGGEVIVDEALSELEVEFGERFMRVHRNALVSPSYVTEFEKERSGRQYVHLSGVEQRVEVSRRLAAKVRKHLKHR